MLNIIYLVAFYGLWAHATIDCEHYLTHDGAEAAAHVFEHGIFSHPVKLADANPVQLVALHRLGLNEIPDKRFVLGTLMKAGPTEVSLDPLIFRIETFDGLSTQILSTISFPDLNSTLWVRVYPKKWETRLSFSELSEEYPRPRQVDHRGSTYLGFQTDPGIDGVRTYLSAHYLKTDRINEIELGVDVPREVYDLFASTEDIEIDRPRCVRTNVAEFCRVPILKFESLAK